jgi:hypothetical protein
VKFALKIPFADEVRDALHKAPFEPFALRLHVGELLKITNPDFLSVTMSGRVIWDDGSGYRNLNPTLIASVEAIRTAKRKGTSKR